MIIPANFLNEGRYLVTPIIADNQAGVSTRREIYLLDENLEISFNVIDTGEMRRSGLSENWLGVVRPRLNWNTRKVI